MINFRVDNKMALVTGCSRGIGMGVAVALAEAGADVIGVSHNMPETRSSMAKGVEAAGRKFYSYSADFSNTKSVYSFLNKVKSKHEGGTFPGMLESRKFNILFVNNNKGVGRNVVTTPGKIITYTGQKVVVKL